MMLALTWMTEWEAQVIGKLSRIFVKAKYCHSSVPSSFDPIRYYGNGFQKQECGMTIEVPTDVDRSVWKCYIGYSEGTHLRTMGAIIDASEVLIIPGDGECVLRKFLLHVELTNITFFRNYR